MSFSQHFLVMLSKIQFASSSSFTLLTVVSGRAQCFEDVILIQPQHHNKDFIDYYLLNK